jgi:hypothetical protein
MPPSTESDLMMCRDHTHPFNELMYSPGPCIVIKESFDADEPGFSSMLKRRMRAGSVGVAASVDPPTTLVEQVSGEGG